MCLHFKATSEAQGEQSSAQDAIQTSLENIVNTLTKVSRVTTEKAKQLSEWLKKYFKYLDEDNEKEEKRYDKIADLLKRPSEYDAVLEKCEALLPKFILFSNYFRIKPALHLKTTF